MRLGQYDELLQIEESAAKKPTNKNTLKGCLKINFTFKPYPVFKANIPSNMY